MAANNCIVFNDLQKRKGNIICFARIDDYWNVLERVTVGESVTTSEPIDLHFNDSIGASKWIIIFYPKGQYNSVGVANGQVSVYLKMLSCDNQDKSLMMDVKFFFKSPYAGVRDEYACTRNANLLYADIKKRWIGPFDLVRSRELYSSQCGNLFVNNTLTIGCELVIKTMSPPRIYGKASYPTSENSYFRRTNYTTSRRSERSPNKETAESLIHNHKKHFMKEIQNYGGAWANQSNESSSKCQLGESSTQGKDYGTWSQRLRANNLKIEKSNGEPNVENKSPNIQVNMRLNVAKTTTLENTPSMLTKSRDNEKTPYVLK